MDNILLLILVGFFAQLVDGTLGMAYGVLSTSFLLSLGLPPATASASVHTAEIFTTGVSGLSHLKFGNVKKQLFLRLLIPGSLGGILGAFILTSFPGKIIKPFISIYLLVMGIIILRKSTNRHPKEKEVQSNLIPLGLAGGFFDAVGGGGWGPIVTSTLLVKGNNPRFTIGSVNLAEFFVTLTEALTFFALIRLSHLKVILALIGGGIIAAPLAAITCKKLPPRYILIIVGSLIIILSIRNLLLFLR